MKHEASNLSVPATKPIRTLPGVIAILGLLLLVGIALDGLPMPRTTIFAREAWDIGHVLLFALVAPALLVILDRFFLTAHAARMHVYLAALLGSALIAAGSELLQLPGPRDADPADFARDMAGALAGLGFAALIDVGLAGRPRTRLAMATVAGAALAVSLWPLASWGLSYRERAASFPVLVSFEPSPWPSFLYLRNLSLREIPAAEVKPGFGSGHVGQLRFHAAPWPSLRLREPVPDWRDFDALALDVLNPSDRTQAIWVRIHDSRHDGRYGDRFNRQFELAPGPASLLIPLDDVQHGPEHRLLDLSAVAGLIIFASQPEEDFELYFDNIRLVRSGSLH